MMTSTPSIVDLYIDGQLNRRERITGGPFLIDEIPVQYGQGTIGVVVTDMLGREQTYTQSIYSSSRLLHDGLAEYSYSIGFLRENLGFESNAYGDAAFVASQRYGLNDRVTVGGRMELAADVVAAAASTDWVLHRGGVVNTGLALSNGDDGSGASTLLGYEFRNDFINLNARATAASSDFDTVGSSLGWRHPKLQMLVGSGLSFGYLGSYGVTLAHQSFYDRDDRDVLTLSHNRRDTRPTAQSET